MGYEIVFSFHERNETGNGYNTEVTKTLKKVVGKATEDTPLEHLAKIVFGQLARRDIWVVDAEICEYTKKKISFKETKDGILLKHKKFGFDFTCGSVEAIEDNGFVDEQVYEEETVPVLSKPKPAVKPIVKEKPLRFEIYDPHPDMAALAKKKGLMFTIGKKYPIFSESFSGSNVALGMSYLTEDDLGNRRTLNDKHFTPIVNLLEGFNEEFTPATTRASQNQATAVSTTNMPVIHTFGR
jgi:hypothetical protein